ncbi:MAG: hypothetical protein ACYCO5_08215 [Acidobacteriaceae bacterium]
MTWIVGTPTMFGYGFALSDVRVTLTDGSEVDCLQKIYPVARWAAAGFAGSVKIGFAMVGKLTKIGNAIEEPYALVPSVLAREWPAYARGVFERFPECERELECHLMLISTDPQEDNGNPNWPRCYVHVFRSPGFEPEEIKVHQMGSIGCGSHYDECRAVIEKFSLSNDRRMFHMKAGIGNQGGMGTSIGHDLTNVLMRTQPSGISSHLHYCWVYRGKIIIETNNRIIKGRWTISPLGHTQDQFDDRDEMLDEGAVAFRMPSRATTWDELDRILRNRNLDSSRAMA